MTDPENNQPLWNDARVESLLEDFFTEEIPLPLRGETPVLPNPVSIAVPAQLQRSQSIAGVLMIGVSALLVVLVAVVLTKPIPTSPSDTVSQPQGNSPDPVTASHSPLENSSEPGPIPNLMNPDVGPVESRPRIQNVHQGDLGSPCGISSVVSRT